MLEYLFYSDLPRYIFMVIVLIWMWVYNKTMETKSAQIKSLNESLLKMEVTMTKVSMTINHLTNRLDSLEREINQFQQHIPEIPYLAFGKGGKLG